jgi:mono/diheme cytochrome c family protein
MRAFQLPTTIFFLIVLGSFIYPGSNSQKKILTGKKLYENNCRSCHKLFDAFVGEPLYGTLERIPDKQWLYKYINGSAMMVTTDPYAACLSKKYNGTLMTMFRLTNEQIDAIYLYTYSEAKKRKDIWNNKKYFEPCK